MKAIIGKGILFALCKQSGLCMCWSGIVVSALASISEVNLCRTPLVLRWLTVSGFNSQCRTFISVCNQPVTKANSGIHPPGVGKWVPASAGKAKTDMVHSVSGCTRGVQVKLWDRLRTCAIPERLRGMITIRRYTNPRLPYLCIVITTGLEVGKKKWQYDPLSLSHPFLLLAFLFSQLFFWWQFLVTPLWPNYIRFHVVVHACIVICIGYLAYQCAVSRQRCGVMFYSQPMKCRYGKACHTVRFPALNISVSFLVGVTEICNREDVCDYRTQSWRSSLATMRSVHQVMSAMTAIH